MRTRSTLRILAALGLLTALALAARSNAAGAAPARKKVTCAEYLADVERTTKSIGVRLALKAGDWGKTPPALRVLPPNASLCGSNETVGHHPSPPHGEALAA